MIETICPHCGNKKTFDDSYAGRTFRCPNCKEPVIIQSIAEIVQPKEDSHEISFDAQLKKAEEDKRIRDEKQRFDVELNRRQNTLKNARIGMAFSILLVLCLIIGTFYSGLEVTIIIAVFVVLALFFLFYGRSKKAKKELEEWQNEQSRDN